MLRFSLKDVLFGITLASIGFGMLAIAFNARVFPDAKEVSATRAFLITFGGMFAGYGLTFPIKYPPYRMLLGMTGMFAATSWQSGSSFGFVIYVGLSALLLCTWVSRDRQAKRKAEQNSPPSVPSSP